jgi:hypothetical protein
VASEVQERGERVKRGQGKRREGGVDGVAKEASWGPFHIGGSPSVSVLGRSQSWSLSSERRGRVGAVGVGWRVDLEWGRSPGLGLGLERAWGLELSGQVGKRRRIEVFF